MENNRTQFLESIMEQIHSLKEQLENLESLVAAHLPATTVEEDLPEEETQSETVPEASVPPETSILTETPVLTETPDLTETVPEAPIPTENAPEEESFPVFGFDVDDAIEVVPIGEASHAAGAVMDKMAEKESWRTDIPGAGVSDIRSAISLNDRILFINTLFHEDPVVFKDTLTALNAMPSFDEGVKFVLKRHPEWNTGSDIVYRFMMAVRRKLK